MPAPTAQHHARATETARFQAVSTLLRITEHGKSLSTLVPEAEKTLNTRDQALYRELVHGLCRWFIQLEAMANELLDHPLRKRDNPARLLILLGLYQLHHMRTPAHAAIHESVELAQNFQMAHRKKLINAILRRFLREKNELVERLKATPTYQFSHPDWFVAKLRANWPDQADTILHANNERAPLTLRINPRRATREAYEQHLQQAGIRYTPCPWARFGLRLEDSLDVRQLPGFDDGLFSVQDEAAQLCASLLELDAPGLNVLDACAAPGGKTTALLEVAPADTRVTALEWDSTRIRRIQDNLTRLDLDADVIRGDATTSDWWDNTPFDRILLDAPCSATGVIRKHPDIKLLRQSEDILSLAETQLAMLNTLWQTLKPGGLLVYATCSVLNQENTRLIERFVKQHGPQAQIEPIDAEWGIQTSTGRQLFPQKGGHDGFFYAKVRKVT